MVGKSFARCHSHGHTCMKSLTKIQKIRHKDTGQIDRLIANSGWDVKDNLVLI